MSCTPRPHSAIAGHGEHRSCRGCLRSVRNLIRPRRVITAPLFHRLGSALTNHSFQFCPQPAVMAFVPAPVLVDGNQSQSSSSMIVHAVDRLHRRIGHFGRDAGFTQQPRGAACLPHSVFGQIASVHPRSVRRDSMCFAMPGKTNCTDTKVAGRYTFQHFDPVIVPLLFNYDVAEGSAQNVYGSSWAWRPARPHYANFALRRHPSAIDSSPCAGHRGAARRAVELLRLRRGEFGARDSLHLRLEPTGSSGGAMGGVRRRGAAGTSSGSRCDLKLPRAFRQALRRVAFGRLLYRPRPAAARQHGGGPDLATRE